MKWILMIFFALNALGTVLTIGKERKPITPEVASMTVLIDLGLILYFYTL